MERTKKAGFSLIEVLIGLFAAGMCAAIVAATMPIANASRSRANDINKATGLAQKQIEAIRGQKFPNITASKLADAGLIDSPSPIGANTYSFTNSDLANMDNPGKILVDGQGQLTLTQPMDGEVQVIVTVSWRDGSERKSVQVGTLIANL